MLNRWHFNNFEEDYLWALGFQLIRAISVFYKKFVSAEYVEAEVFILPQGLVPRFFVFFSCSAQLRLKFILLINV